jgi:hypothetical protein
MEKRVALRANASADMRDRIDALAHALPRLSPCRLAHAIDDLRRTARMQGFDHVAELAHQLERRLSTTSDAALAIPYLEAMSDAARPDGAATGL